MPKNGVFTMTLSIMVDDTVGVHISARLISSMSNFMYVQSAHLLVRRYRNALSFRHARYNLDLQWHL